MRRHPGGASEPPLGSAPQISGSLLFRLSALRAAQFFARQFLMEGLATIDADLAAFVFSAHA
jgi:hypothetical protein